MDLSETQGLNNRIAIDDFPVEDQILNSEQMEEDDDDTVPTIPSSNESSSSSNGTIKLDILLKRYRIFSIALKEQGKTEFIQLFKLSWPIVISSVCAALLGTTDMAFVGRLGKEYLAAAALGNAIFYCTSFVPLGFLGAQDTLISQAEGANNERMKRLVLYRSILMITLIIIPIIALFMVIDKILVLIGTEKQIAVLTGQFIRLNSIGLWPYCLVRILAIYLTAQQYVHFPMFVSMLSVIVNTLLNYVMIFAMSLGFTGAPLATSMTRFIMMVLLILYSVYIERKKAKNNREYGNNNELMDVSNEHDLMILKKIKPIIKNICHLRGIIEYIKLGIPSSVGTCLEVWGFELTTIFSSLLGSTAYVGAHSIILNVCVVTFMIPMSISIASSIRIGICLGSKEADRAKIASLLGLSLCVTIMACNALILFFSRKVIGNVFTNNSDIISIVISVLPIGAMFQIFDGTQVSLGGILRGIGKQKISAIANFISYYVIGLPMGCLLCFYFKWKLAGLWVGLLLGLFSVSILLFLYVICMVDFEKEVQNAQDRVHRSDIDNDANVDEEAAVNDQELPDNVEA
jgi:MATE family multidrug resistance protein